VNAAHKALQVIKGVLSRHSEPAGRDPNEINDDAAVFGPGGVITDSLNILDALSEIESDLGISIPDEDLTEELFASVRNFAAYIERRRAARLAGEPCR
jgi:acyl carrier protein